MNKILVIILTSFLLISCYGKIINCALSSCSTLPGDTKVDLSTQSFAAKQAFSQIRYLYPNCSSYESYKISNTTVTSYGEWKYGPSWKESWKINACGTEWIVPMHFEADGKGNTNVGTSANWIKRVDQ
jgi:hypothetical protein